MTIRSLQARNMRNASFATGELGNWLQQAADLFNTLPPYSVFSLTNPNSQVSAIPGTLGINLNSANTSKFWIKEVGSGNTGWSSLATGVGPVASGTYVPTLTNAANLDGSTSDNFQYMRVGNVVTVSGHVDVNPTAPATDTQLGISLPISSNFTKTTNCAGVGFAPNIAGQGAAILGNIGNDYAQMEWTSGDVTNQPMYLTFTYVIA